MLSEKLKELLIKSVKNCINEKNVAIAFSGGLDSSVIAKIAKKYFKASLYVVGTKGCLDIESAKFAAKTLKLKLEIIEINKKDIESAIPELIKINGCKNPVFISFTLPFYFVAKNCKEKILISGQGPDELFGGYAKYLKGYAQKEMKKDLENLKLTIEKQRKIANHFEKELKLPYLDKEIVDFAIKIPIKYKIHGEVRKYILIQVAKQIGLPKEIAERKKKAAQYGSGAMKEIKKLAKERNLNVNEYIFRLV